MRSSVNRIALGTIIGEQPWREMLAADKAKVIDLPPILRARIDLYNSRLHAIDARSPPDAGRLRVVVRQLVPVLRHRQHPHGAERGNHRDIHDNPHGPIPRFTQWENWSPCQEFREGAEILRVWLSGNESTHSFCPTSLSSLPKAS